MQLGAIAASINVARRPTLETQNAVLEHLITAVETAKLETEPFCHFAMTNCFPTDFYRAMLSNLPDRSLCTPFNLKRYRRPSGESLRDEFHFMKSNIARLPDEAGRLWTDVVGALTHPSFRRTVFSKLALDLAERFGVSQSAITGMTCRYQILLSRESDTYRLNPHPDGLNKIASLLFYLPQDDSHSELGTSVYRKKGGLFGLLPGAFEEVRRSAFLPNSGFSFAVSDSKKRKSWHGREKVHMEFGERNLLHMFFVQDGPLPD